MPGQEECSYKFGPFLGDPGDRLLLREGKPVPLTPKAYETLLALLQRGGRLVEKEELLKAVWPGTFVEESTLAQNIFTLRKVLGDTPEGRQYIETVAKRGYRFVAPVNMAQQEARTLEGPRFLRAPLSCRRFRAIAGILVASVGLGIYFRGILTGLRLPQGAER